MKKRSLLFLVVLFVFFAAPGVWAQFGDLLKNVGGSGLLGGNTGQLLDSAGNVVNAAQKANEDFTPVQEYYIGRAVGADITGMYKVAPIDKATLYLNALVQVLAAASTMPETYGGYHVLILDSETINALSAPGGYIFVTKGLLRCTSNETSLAAVLAHEIGHIENRHGIKAIKQARQTEMWAVIGKETAKNLGNEDLKKATDTFGDSVTDVVETMVNNGYSRDQEAQADTSAVDILRRAGYDPVGLVMMLDEMKKRLKPGGNDFAKTHPSPDVRIKTVREKIGGTENLVTEPIAWTSRYHAAMDGL